jgi:probable F420-dependent oxidoreductase
MTTDDKAGRLGHAARSLGRFGVWRGGREVSPDLAVTIEQLGYGALWIGGSPDGELAQIEELLAATTTLTLATGIVNIWQDDAQTVAASFHRIEARFPGRFLLGVGAGHPEATQAYAKPYAALAGYVDALLGADVPPGAVVLAALGPQVLRLAAERTAGAHPYLITPEHTKRAREIMGTGPLLAPEQKVVLDDDPMQARIIGRPRVAKPYLGLTNYTSNLRRLGWTDADLSDGGSDALIDALVAHGPPGQVAGRLHEHLDAGADHVCVQLLTQPGDDLVGGYRRLAEALGF